MGTSVRITMCGLWLWKRTAAASRIRGFVRGAGVKVRATRGRPPSGWLHQGSAPTRDLCQGLASGLHRGLGAQQGPTLAKAVAFGRLVVSRVVLVERLVVDALW